MSTERNPVIDLDRLAEEGRLFEVAETPDAPPALLRLQFTLGQWERVKRLMPRLRAENISVVLMLKRGDAEIGEEQLTEIFAQLRLWDQFTLHNLLELCGGWFTPRVLTPLQQEAKIELMWFEQWSTASTDSRLHKYPTLPWRRFIRKATTENYQFFTKVLEQWGNGELDEEKKVEGVVAAFLTEKRKAVNIAPKRFKGKA